MSAVCICGHPQSPGHYFGDRLCSEHHEMHTPCTRDGCDCHQYRPRPRGINSLRSALHEFYDTPTTDLWLESPHPLLQGAAPGDLVDTEFEDQVWALIDQLRSGAIV